MGGFFFVAPKTIFFGTVVALDLMEEVCNDAHATNNWYKFRESNKFKKK